MNGEPIANAHVLLEYEFHFGELVAGCEERKARQQTKTNRSGEIKITAKVRLSRITVSAYDLAEPLTKSWEINSVSEQIHYSEEMSAFVG